MRAHDIDWQISGDLDIKQQHQTANAVDTFDS
jgi:hypothetical protein